MTAKTLDNVRCVFAPKSVDRFDEYFEQHPEDVDDIKAGLAAIADGPRDLNATTWNYKGLDLPDSYIHLANDHIVILYQIIAYAPVCVLGLVAILDDRDFPAS